MDPGILPKQSYPIVNLYWHINKEGNILNKKEKPVFTKADRPVHHE